MANFGTIEPFIANSGESIVEYFERLEFYYVANGIVDAEKKKATLLSVLGR